MRYADATDLDAVAAPPYDVVSPDDWARLASRSEHNAILIEVPAGDAGTKYRHAADLLAAWRAEGVLVTDSVPAFYGYRMSFDDEQGQPRQTTGVIGALELSGPDEGEILPHERTTPKDKADRLELLRSTQLNTSPVWGLTPSPLTGRLQPVSKTLSTTDEDGVVHELWLITDRAQVDAISDAVAAAPITVADGHHRTEVALAYRDERRAAGDGEGPWDFVMALVVELAPEQLDVRPIHRLIDRLPADIDLPSLLGEWFEVSPTAPIDATIAGRMADSGSLALVTADGTWLMKPRPETVKAAEHDLDSSRLDVALAGIPQHGLRFQHGSDLVAAAVQKGEAQAGVLLRPATVEQIAATGRGEGRMPPKTTFFYPKPRTGLVFRPAG
ncbi:MAG: hypothetical protein QOG03_431 [Actinomycetota bacterium]|jgi:uncharacterized protein (DUF1015 family)|nr:hypothetical protein [Actinomycetota bacterium]